MGKYLLTALLVLGFASTIYAAPVGLTSEADATDSFLWPNEDLELSIGLIGDIVERKIEIDSGEFEMNAFMARIGVSALKKFNVYVDLGIAQDMEYDYVIQGETYTSEFDDQFIYGIGASALIQRWENGLELGVNASYRRAEMEFDRVTINSTSYKRSDMTAIAEGDFIEYQGALEVAWKNDCFTPYAGVKYSEVEVDANFTLYGAQRDANNQNASENVGVFVGLTITPKFNLVEEIDQQLAINLEGRFIDEEAFNVGVSYKF